MVLVNKTPSDEWTKDRKDRNCELFPLNVTFNGMVGRLTKRGEGQNIVAYAMIIDETGPGYDDITISKGNINDNHE